MGSCMSDLRASNGAFEQPGAHALAAFIAERDAIYKQRQAPLHLHIPSNDEDVDCHQSPVSPTSASSTSKSLAGKSPILDSPKTYQTAVFSQKKKSPIQPEPEPVRRRTMEAPPVPVSGPSTSNSTISEKRQGELVAQLYSSNIPAEDIALVVKAMRGGCTTEEHAELLHRLFKLDVSSTLMAQLVDVIRSAPRLSSSANATVVRSNDAGEMRYEPPPVYDAKPTHILE